MRTNIYCLYPLRQSFVCNSQIKHQWGHLFWGHPYWLTCAWFWSGCCFIQATISAVSCFSVFIGRSSCLHSIIALTSLVSLSSSWPSVQATNRRRCPFTVPKSTTNLLLWALQMRLSFLAKNVSAFGSSMRCVFTACSSRATGFGNCCDVPSITAHCCMTVVYKTPSSWDLSHSPLYRFLI